MKILCFTDMHGSHSAMRKLKEKAKKADIIICSGDFTIFEQGILKIMKEFDSFGRKMLVINGNHESQKLVTAMAESMKNIVPLHKRVFAFDGILFAGFGDSGFGRRDKEFDSWIRSESKKLKGKKTVLVVHGPPYMTKADRLGDEHCGSRSSQDFIRRFRPLLVVCGHLHENNGADEVKDGTRIINPGPFGKIVRL